MWLWYCRKSVFLYVSELWRLVQRTDKIGANFDTWWDDKGGSSSGRDLVGLRNRIREVITLICLRWQVFFSHKTQKLKFQTISSWLVKRRTCVVNVRHWLLYNRSSWLFPLLEVVLVFFWIEDGIELRVVGHFMPNLWRWKSRRKSGGTWYKTTCFESIDPTVVRIRYIFHWTWFISQASNTV